MSRERGPSSQPSQPQRAFICADQLETSTPPPPPPPGKPRAFELLKIGSFKFPPPRAKMVFKCLIVGFVCQMPLLKNNRCRLLSSLTKLVYKHANTFRDPLYDGAVFTDFSYYKNTTLTLKLLKNDLKLN